jgi:hypothetical protein
MNSHEKHDLAPPPAQPGGQSRPGPNSNGAAALAQAAGVVGRALAPHSTGNDNGSAAHTVTVTPRSAEDPAPSQSMEPGDPQPRTGAPRRRARLAKRLTTAPRRKTMTPAALAANKRNAQKSTGPKSDAGKEASSRNAVTHGLTAIKTSIVVQGKEDAEAYEDLQRLALEEYRPRVLTEEWGVRQLGNAMWSVLRGNRAQVAAIKEAMRTGGREPRANDLVKAVFGEKPRDDWRRTGSGVSAAAEALATFISEAQASRYSDAEFWRWVRETATELKALAPRLARLVEANDQAITQTAALSVLEEAKRDLQERAVKLKAKETERRALNEELGLVPDTHFFHNVMRYTAAADRAVRRWMKLLAPVRQRAAKTA